MNKHDATEEAYKNGYQTGGADAARKILGGIKAKLQKVSFSDIKERFLIFDLIKSYEEDFKQDEGGMHIRVPYAMEIGQKVYMNILYGDFDEEEEYVIFECTVSDIGLRGFWISACEPPRNDHGDFVAWNRVGDDVFFTREEAENAVNSKCEIRNSELEDTE